MLLAGNKAISELGSDSVSNSVMSDKIGSDEDVRGNDVLMTDVTGSKEVDDAKGAGLEVNPTAGQLWGVMREVPNGRQGSTVKGTALAGYVWDKIRLGEAQNTELVELFTAVKGANGANVIGTEVVVVVTGAMTVLADNGPGLVGNLGWTRETIELRGASVEPGAVVDLTSPDAAVALHWESGRKMVRCCFRSCSLL